MRFMLIVKATPDSEAGVMPSTELLTEMGRLNEEMVRAAVMLAGDGLHPSSRGARVRFSGGVPEVIDGPFAETKELISGFWVIQAASQEAALGWARRVPFQEGQIEVRQIFEADDFGAEFTPELREREDRLRADIAQR
jgi:hypothetical protein